MRFLLKGAVDRENPLKDLFTQDNIPPKPCKEAYVVPFFSFFTYAVDIDTLEQLQEICYSILVGNPVIEFQYIPTLDFSRRY